MRPWPLLLLMLASGDLLIQVSPSEVIVSPGEYVNVTIFLMNRGKEEINVTGFEVRVMQNLPLIPASIPIASYDSPLEEPISLEAGESKVIYRVFEVPRIAYSGDFSVLITAKTSKGNSTAEMRVSMGIPINSAISLAITILLEVSTAYLFYLALKRRIKPEDMIERRIKRIRSIIGWKKYDEEILRLIEERKAWGTYEDGYERHSDAVRRADELISILLRDLREEERRMELSIEAIKLELSDLKEKIDNEKSRYLEKILDKKEKMLREVRNLIAELERSASARVA
jgi:hypothetical protein